MFDPPPAYADMLTDAGRCPVRGEPEPLEVRRIGTLMARRPAPRDVAALAMAGNPDATPRDQHDHVALFLVDCLGEDGYEELLAQMSADDATDDTVQRVVRALAVWGTSRPFTAVITLAVWTGYHWRTLRAHLQTHGISDPLVELPTMSALLDAMERMCLEGQENAKARERFIDKLYMPRRENQDIDDGYEGTPAAPTGFSAADTEASFEAFRAAAAR